MLLSGCMYGNEYSYVVMPVVMPDSLRFEMDIYFIETKEQVPGLAAALFS